MSERRCLQAAVAVLAMVPVTAGGAGVLLGWAVVDPGAGLDADSHGRYLSGLLLAVGLGFWSTLPRIEAQAARFRLLAAIVFVGGLARLASLLAVGVPSAGMLFALAMELGVAPALALWRERIARRR